NNKKKIESQSVVGCLCPLIRNKTANDFSFDNPCYKTREPGREKEKKESNKKASQRKLETCNTKLVVPEKNNRINQVVFHLNFQKIQMFKLEVNLSWAIDFVQCLIYKTLYD